MFWHHILKLNWLKNDGFLYSIKCLYLTKKWVGHVRNLILNSLLNK